MLASSYSKVPQSARRFGDFGNDTLGQIRFKNDRQIVALYGIGPRHLVSDWNNGQVSRLKLYSRP